ncbi:MAG: polysaccharide biosynthesis protein [Chthonomonas sp.]|nr:polysaccharide biosynthesis protein [Chthonomonas sp.]
MSNPLFRFGRAFFRILPDLVWIQFSLAAALYIGMFEQWVLNAGQYFSILAGPMLAISVATLLWRGIHRIDPRYVGLYDQLNLSLVSVVLALGLGCLDHFQIGLQNVSFPLIFGFLCLVGMTGSRVVTRLVSWGNRPWAKPSNRIRTLIVGAGDAGEFVLRELGRVRNEHRAVIGFVDDDPLKSSLIIQGVRVLGKTADVPHLVKNLNIDEIILCIPSADGATMRRINDLCMRTNVRVRTLPSVSGLLYGAANLRQQLRKVDLEDLLRRPATEPDPDLLSKITAGESVLITGGGGSIGSELARQVSALEPARLILLGKGENSLYEIEQELIQTTDFIPNCVVADVRDADAMEYTFVKHKPSVVFHAAAHKHVPLMQSNPIEAIRNNVFGTLCAVETAVRHRAHRFVLISTDKAVKPTSVMGATKRVAEMVVGAYAPRSTTNFSVVRFGNVLGSRGSLIPLMKNQIMRGGPVRITHPDMTRYFMTIPEAVQLILQAGAIGENGELFILDMGDPVKILDLAYDLIRLHGLVPHEDIDVKFIGPRPGEKLYEELTYDKESLIPTDQPKIRMALTSPIDFDWLMMELDALKTLCNAGEQDRAHQYLMELAWGKHDNQAAWDKRQAA